MASYPIPPWLAASPAEFGSAAAAGANIRMQRARLAEEARQANLRASMVAAELNAHREAQQQQINRQQVEDEFQRQIQQAQIGLRTRQLDQAEEGINLDVQVAGRKLQAQMEAQRRIQAGEDPSKVWSELGPAAGVTGSGIASLMKKPMQLGAARPIEGLEGYKAFERSPGNFQVIPPSSVPGDIKASQVIGADGKPIPNVFTVPGGPGRPPTVHTIPQDKESAAIDRLIEERHRRMAGAPAEAKKSVAAQKVDMAHELAAQHPEWTKAKILEEVNKAFSGK